VQRFELSDDRWPIVIDLFEVYTPSLPDDYVALLTALLVQMDQAGTVLAWYMYDGAFGAIGDLFSPWQAAQTYGVVFPNHMPTLAIRDSDRHDPAWNVLLSQAAHSLYTRYPELKSFISGA
jgi:hypothetical protein